MSDEPHSFRFHLPDPAATDMFARRVAALLGRADCILLDGPIGAGKTHFARAAIRALTHDAQEVPSPTYTLMQGYDAGDRTIWHMDLYRLGEPEELMELGLDTALEDAITLIEWPERLGSLTPARHMSITLAQSGEGREAVVHLVGGDWKRMSEGLS